MTKFRREELEGFSSFWHFDFGIVHSLWGRDGLNGKAEADIQTKVKEENGPVFGAAVSGRVLAIPALMLGSHALTFWFCFILSNSLTSTWHVFFSKAFGIGLVLV